MQPSTIRHSSEISMTPTGSLTSGGNGSDGFAEANCTNGASDTGAGDESSGARSTLNFGASGAAAMFAATTVSGSAATAVSASAATAVPGSTALAISISGFAAVGIS